MDLKKKIENQLKSAELYCKQGLYQDAKAAYQTASKLIKGASNLKNKDSLLAAMEKKLKELNFTAEQVETAPPSHELPENVQNLIKNLFSFSEETGPDAEALAGAITLAKFGQTERAIQELTNLLERESVRLAAAKNILQCFLFSDNHEKAIEAYNSWTTSGTFSEQHIENIRLFLEDQLSNKGIEISSSRLIHTDPQVTVTSNSLAPPDEAIVDIGSVLINFDQGPLKGKPVELDVNFQTGNTVSLLIESKDKSILEDLNVGFHLKDVQYRSSVAIFRGNGVVKAKLKIHEGPKKGDYHMDIKVQE